ncbi:MAG: FAD-dependent oxidoreductase, partial [Bacteroidota bacterium]
MKKNYELVVIGGGPAAMTLAKRLGKKMDMAIIRPEQFSLVYCAMPYVIEDLIEKDKCLKTDSLVTDSGAELIKNKVVDIDFQGKTLVLENQETVSWQKLVVATGATPFIPPVEGNNLNGVMGFKTQKDLDVVDEYVRNGLKKAVIVGAGAIGLELAQAMKHKGLDVSLVDMADHVLPNLVGKEFAQKASEEVIKNGIHLVLNSRVDKLKGDDFVEEVHLDNGEVIYLDEFAPCTVQKDKTVKGLVIFATGVKPELSYIPDNTLEIGKEGIVVDERMQTNIPDVYAMGDCVQFNNFITGKVSPGKLATNAIPMATVLAKNLTGRDKTYKGFINGAATKVYNYYVGGTGLSAEEARNEGFDVVEGYSQLTTKFPIMPGVKELRVKLLADRNTSKIIGGQVLSGEPVTSIVDLITFAIQQEATAEELAELSYSSHPYQSFFPAANPVSMAAEQIDEQVAHSKEADLSAKDSQRPVTPGDWTSPRGSLRQRWNGGSRRGG